MTSHTGLTRLVLGAAAALLLLGALTGTASAAPDVVKPHGVFRLTGTLPSWLLAPEMETNCLMRWEGDWVPPDQGYDGSVVFREVCYRGTTIDPNATPGPPPYLGDIPEYTFEHEVLSDGVYYEQGTLQFPEPDLLIISVLPCTAVLPGSLYVEFRMEFDIDGGQETGTAFVTTDGSGNCNSGTTTEGSITLDPLPLDNDTDGDGCTDWYELGENPELGGLNDPFNPTDCDGLPGGADELYAYGLYDISHKITHNLVPGYRHCRLSVTQFYTTALIIGAVYCYTDIPGVAINPEAYPGTSGDGLPGAPPPGPEHTPGNLAFGDVNGSHAFIAGPIIGGTQGPDGRYVGGTATLEGCFNDEDGQDPLGHVIVRWEWDVQTGAGTSETWTNQAVEDCTYPPTPVGVPETEPLQAMKLATTAQSDACYGQPGVCPFADTDGDGARDVAELQSDTICGRRDPFNPNDYYDVSQPRDSVIDLPNDIMGVILHFAPGGNPPYDANWDRPVLMTANSGHWNRGSSDGVIDLPNDILGVQLQFNPAGC